MKKLIIILGLILSFNMSGICVFAQSQNAVTLGKIENSLYGFQYNNEDETSRLNRIEKTVYGVSTNKNNAQKLSALKKDLSADLFGQEIAPKEDTFAEESDSIKDDNSIAQNTSSTGPGVDYPAINELEKEVFKKEFKTQDLDTRLSNLEQKALGKTYKTEDFSTRVDRLRAELKPRSLMDNAIAQSSNDFYDDEPIELDKNYNLDKYSSPTQFDYDDYNSRNRPQYYNTSPKRVNLSAVEKSMFKQTYPNDDMNNRLSRLESTMFGTTFNSDSQQDRLNRISSAYKATKSAGKYDSNKFSQNAMTAVQIGTLILMVLACIL